VLETLRNAWKIVDLRKKILYTLFILFICRVGAAIPVPFIDPSSLAKIISQQSGNMLGFLDIMTGGAFSKATLFAMNISPYITASIVIQLLTIAIPALERLSKEGADGRKKIQKITRYTTVALAAVQSIAYYVMFRNMGSLSYTDGFAGVFTAVVIVCAFSAGAMLVMWLGERIDAKGIGNGISMILFASIVSRSPQVMNILWQYLKFAGQGSTQYYFYVPLVVAIFVVLISVIVVMTNAERRIPVQYAKRMVGRKMYGGQSTHIPIKVNMSGVMPIIFSTSLISIPGLIKGFIYPQAPSNPGFWYKFLSLFDYNGLVYAILAFILIIAFNYFYVAIQYNPIEMANNLRKNNGTIPGIRPGKPTSDFISKIIAKITFVGALFLAVIAVLPIGVGALTNMTGIALGGTSIIIVVGVALDTVRQLESQMMMRHYKGFLE